MSPSAESAVPSVPGTRDHGRLVGADRHPHDAEPATVTMGAWDAEFIEFD